MIAAGVVLAVDLDGTLLRSDMLHETLLAAAHAAPMTVVRAGLALRRGRAALKAELAEVSAIDPAGLPYDARVLDEIARWRAAGGRTALVTASDARIAGAIAAHLDIFDEVHSSDGDLNLKGEAKRRHLEAAFGSGGFVYVGDSAADLAVWPGAAAAISVGAAPRVRRALDTLGIPARHIGADRRPLRAMLREMRPHQWLKNLLVFLPLLADHAFDTGSVLAAVAAFAALSMMASAGYVANDLLDLEDDRNHPRKRARPIASGELPIAAAVGLCGALVLAGAAIALAVSPLLLGLVVIYLATTLTYSVWLKRHRLIDICTLAALYTLRIAAGTIAIAAEPSVWMFAFSLFLFFSLAAVKRLGELSGEGTGARAASRRGYTPSDRSVIMQMAVSSGYVAVLVLALYVDEARARVNFGEPWMLWAVCPVLLAWLSLMVMEAGRGEMHDDPIVHTLRDPKSRWLILAMGALILGAVAL
ncbi:UbiA family prenyltransferase [Rhodobacteraceae bacterium ASV31]|nr:UbiA family prenyltransferase [Anianabacter salinae]